jgi:hypothetical protein
MQFVAKESEILFVDKISRKGFSPGVLLIDEVFTLDIAGTAN